METAAKTYGASHGGSQHEPQLSEAEFLAQQAEEAKAAFKAAWHELTGSVKNAADLTEWAKKYPWWTAGAAAAAGFAASYVLIPATRDEAKKKWEHLKSAVKGTGPDGKAATVEVNGEEYELRPATKEKPAAQGIVAMILTEALKLLRPILTAMAANMSTQQQPSAPAETQNSSAS